MPTAPPEGLGLTYVMVSHPLELGDWLQWP